MSDNAILENAIEQNNFTDANKFIYDFINQLIVLFSESKTEEIEKELDINKTRFSYYVDKKLFEKSTDFVFGRFIGFSEAFSEILSIENKREKIRNSFNTDSISEIPHVFDIIMTINENEGIRHGVLADKVGIEKSTLSGIMDKLVEKGAVRFSRPGKFKYYFLTSFGLKYYEENKNTINAGSNIDAITEQLLIALSKEDDINGKIIEILKCLADGSGKYKHYKAKNKEPIDTSRIFAGIPSIKPQRVMLPDRSVQIINEAIAFKATPKNDSIVFLMSDVNDNKLLNYALWSENN